MRYISTSVHVVAFVYVFFLIEALTTIRASLKAKPDTSATILTSSRHSPFFQQAFIHSSPKQSSPSIIPRYFPPSAPTSNNARRFSLPFAGTVSGRCWWWVIVGDVDLIGRRNPGKVFRRDDQEESILETSLSLAWERGGGGGGGAG